jgi:hypothetical protein
MRWERSVGGVWNLPLKADRFNIVVSLLFASAGHYNNAWWESSICMDVYRRAIWVVFEACIKGGWKWRLRKRVLKQRWGCDWVHLQTSNHKPDPNNCHNNIQKQCNLLHDFVQLLEIMLEKEVRHFVRPGLGLCVPRFSSHQHTIPFTMGAARVTRLLQKKRNVFITAVLLLVSSELLLDHLLVAVFEPQVCTFSQYVCCSAATHCWVDVVIGVWWRLAPSRMACLLQCLLIWQCF